MCLDSGCATAKVRELDTGWIHRGKFAKSCQLPVSCCGSSFSMCTVANFTHPELRPRLENDRGAVALGAGLLANELWQLKPKAPVVSIKS